MGHDKGLKGGRWEIWLDFKGFLRRWILSWCVDELAYRNIEKQLIRSGFNYPQIPKTTVFLYFSVGYKIRYILWQLRQIF
jgi:hypothetical protein